ncbi:hypothetical protein AZA_32292 [Nitrospirillum viridazoti Y2]|nr:hypothetical protein AZA_32292 [Nitrospirillum amazonense Y2]
MTPSDSASHDRLLDALLALRARFEERISAKVGTPIDAHEAHRRAMAAMTRLDQQRRMKTAYPASASTWIERTVRMNGQGHTPAPSPDLSLNAPPEPVASTPPSSGLVRLVSFLFGRTK